MRKEPVLFTLKQGTKLFYERGLPLITYAPRGRGGQASYTFPLRITCKKGGRGSRKHVKLRT